MLKIERSPAIVTASQNPCNLSLYYNHPFHPGDTMRLLILLAIISANSYAYGPYAARHPRVVDGDTIEVDVMLWPGLSQRVSVRLMGVDTPETRTKLLCEKAMGLSSKRFVADFIQSKSLVVDNVIVGKFAGRVVGNILVDGIDLSSELIKRGYGRGYDGGKRMPWCKGL